MKITYRKDRIHEKLKSIADTMPKFHYRSNEKANISGEDVILSGLDTSKVGKVDPEKEYSMVIPRYQEVNHCRRMKRAFKSGGIEGVWNYCKTMVPDDKKAIMKNHIYTYLA